MGDIALLIRHAKRANAKDLDLSNKGLTEIPVDILKLNLLETINLSNNKIVTLKNLERLPNLREINAMNNNISMLNPEIEELFVLESICL